MGLGNPKGSVNDSDPAKSTPQNLTTAEALLDSYKSADFKSAFVYAESEFPLGNSTWGKIASTGGAKWIGSQDGATFKKNVNGAIDTGISHATGYYAYQTTFTATADFNYLDGWAATDNLLLGILLNGELLPEDTWNFNDDATRVNSGSTFDKANWYFYLTGEDGVISGGENTLTFLIANYSWDGKNNPTGLWLEASLVNELRGEPGDDFAPTPEPATLLILGLGLAGLGLARRIR